MNNIRWLLIFTLLSVAGAQQAQIGQGGQTGSMTLNSGQSGTALWGAVSGGGPPPPPPSTREDLYLPSQVDGPCVYTGGANDGPATLPVNCMATYMSATPAPGSVVIVNTVSDLNTLINGTLACGDIVEINSTSVLQQQSGFIFPALACDDAHWIWITSNQYLNPNFPPEHTRATPCFIGQTAVPGYPKYSCNSPQTLFPTLQSTNGKSTIAFAPGANHYRIFGLNLPQYEVNNASGNGLINTGGGNHIIAERNLLQGEPFKCTISGWTWSCPFDDTTHGIITAASTYVAIMYNWVWDIGVNGADSDATGVGLGGNDCTGTIDDVKFLFGNMIAATGENYFAGGGGCPTGTTATPNDLIIANNHFWKNPVWDYCTNGPGGGCGGAHTVYKNNGELKNWNRALVEGNTYENNWAGWQTDQDGFLSLLTPKNQSIRVNVNAISDSTGTILTGSFPSAVGSPQCANGGHCEVTFPFGGGNGQVVEVQSWTSTFITVSPALTAINTSAVAQSCEPGANPSATVTNVTYRYNEFRNGHNGITNGAGVSDCNDTNLGASFNSFHDNLFHGIYWQLDNNIISQHTGESCFYNFNGMVAPDNLHDFSEIHNTCIIGPPHKNAIYGLSEVLDSTATTQDGTTGSYFANETYLNNIAFNDGQWDYKLGTYYGPSLTGLNQTGCTPPLTGTCTWQFAGNVFGQAGDGPYASTNQTCQTATCFPTTNFQQQFVQYNGPNGEPGYRGNYQLASTSPYLTGGTDGLPVGVSNWTNYNAAILNSRSGDGDFPAASIQTTFFPPATVGSVYTQTLNATGAGGTYGNLIWLMPSGSLPTGMSLSPPSTACGANIPFWCITGTPAAGTAGSYTFTLQVIDGAQQYAQQTYTLQVNNSGPSQNPNWQLVSTPASATQMATFTINRTTNEWYVGDRNTGFWKSTNKGAAWSQINGANTLSTTDSALNTGTAVSTTYNAPGTSGINGVVSKTGTPNLWLMYDNPWGITSGSGTLTQAYSGTGSVAFTMNMTGLPTGAVIAYPFILAGCDPFSNCYNGQGLTFPAQLSSMSNLYSDINYTFSGTFTGFDTDLLYDEWVCNNPAPTNSTQCLEVEILPYYNFAVGTGATFVKTVTYNVTINGTPTTMSFDEYEGTNILFIPHTAPGTSSQEIKLDLLQFLNEGVSTFGSNGACTPNACQWVTGMELGTEFGHSTTANYALTFSKIELDQVFSGLPLSSTIQAWTIQIDPQSGDLIAGTLDAAAASNDHFYKSNNDGLSWQQINIPGFHTSEAGAFTGCILPASSGANLVCGGFFGSNNTSQFYTANDGATGGLGTYTPAVSSVRSIARNPVDSSYWTGTENGGIYQSTNQGVAWSQIWAYVQGPPTNGDTDFIAFDSGGDPLLSSQGGVWRGTGCPNSCTWTVTFGNTQVGRAIFTDSLGSVYWSHRVDVNKPDSLYRSLDGGQTWNPWDTGLAQEWEVDHIEENPTDGQIYILLENGSTNAASIYASPK